MPSSAGPEPDIDPHRSVDRRDCLLADRLESTLIKFIGEHRNGKPIPASLVRG